MGMDKCHICDYAAIERRMLLSHFREKHGFRETVSEGRGKGLGTRLRRCIFEGKVSTVDGKTFDKYRIVDEGTRVTPSSVLKSISDKKKTRTKLGKFKCGKCDFTSSSKTSIETTTHKFACGKMPRNTMKSECEKRDKSVVIEGDESEKQEIIKTFRIQDTGPEEVMSNLCADIKEELECIG